MMCNNNICELQITGRAMAYSTAHLISGRLVTCNPKSYLILVTTGIPPLPAVAYLFQTSVLVRTGKANWLPILSQIYALFGVLFTAVNNAVAYQKWQISGMPKVGWTKMWLLSTWKMDPSSECVYPEWFQQCFIQQFRPADWGEGWKQHWTGS